VGLRNNTSTSRLDEPEGDQTMAQYVYRDQEYIENDIVIIEDPSLFKKTPDGRWEPSYAFIDSLTVRAHPSIIDSLVEQSERIWSLDELLESTQDWDA
jgi:hypothetical protein